MSVRALRAFIVLACVAGLAWSTTASAGIIVTVGKFGSQMSSGDDTLGGDSDPSPRTGDERVKLTTGAISDPEPGAQADDAADDWGDFGEIRAGFAGTNIGGGIVYSDRDDAVGAGPGPGQGGALDHDAALDDDEIAVMGCQGGGASGPVIAALLLLLGVAWRRRQLA